MPLNNRAVSSLPVITGIFGEGAGVGVFSGTSISTGVSGASCFRCHCSRETQRSTIAVNAAASRTRTKNLSVLIRIFRTPRQLFFDPGDDRDNHADHTQ